MAGTPAGVPGTSHDVDRSDSRVRAASLSDGFLGLVRQMRRHFQTGVAIGAVVTLEDRQQQIAGLANVVDGQGFVDVISPICPAASQPISAS